MNYISVLIAAVLMGLAVFWALAGSKINLSKMRSIRLSDERIETQEKAGRSAQEKIIMNDDFEGPDSFALLFHRVCPDGVPRLYRSVIQYL